MTDEQLRLAMRRLKQIASLKVPNYDLPADSQLEEAVRDIVQIATSPSETIEPLYREGDVHKAVKRFVNKSVQGHIMGALRDGAALTATASRTEKATPAG